MGVTGSITQEMWVMINADRECKGLDVGQMLTKLVEERVSRAAQVDKLQLEITKYRRLYRGKCGKGIRRKKQPRKASRRVRRQVKRR